MSYERDEILKCFPLRYFDLEKCASLSFARVGFEATFIAKVVETKSDFTLSNQKFSRYLLEDKTGCITVFIPSPTKESLNTFCVGDKVVVSGVVTEFDLMKCVFNPLIRHLNEKKFPEVVPAYSRVLNLEKKDILDVEIPNNSLFEKDDLLAIHGFLSKEKMLEAREKIKFQQLFETQLLCLKNKTTLEKMLLFPYAQAFLNDFKAIEIDVLDRSDFGNAIDQMKIKLEKGSEVFIVCPLAYKTRDERDNMVFKSEDFKYVPLKVNLPKISIENEMPVDFNNVLIKKRYNYFISILGECYRDYIFVKSGFRKNEKIGNNSVLVIEDADRFSSLEILNLSKRADCKTILITNSKNNLNILRLKNLSKIKGWSEALFHELSFRRDGDHLGRNDEIFNNMSLVNLYRDKKTGELAREKALEFMNLK